MNKSMNTLIMLSFMIILISTISRQNHFLPTLLCLESMMLLIIYFMPMLMNHMYMNMSPSTIILLAMSVSTVTTGTSLMVMASRKDGNDSTMNNSMNKC